MDPWDLPEEGPKNVQLCHLGPHSRIALDSLLSQNKKSVVLHFRSQKAEALLIMQ